MSYRKIEVDGKTYEYVVGKTTTKVKGVGVFRNSDYGVPVECTDTYVISAAGVKRMVRGLPGKPYKKTCERHGLPITALTFSPFAAEIYGKTVLVDNCPECLYNSRMDI